MTDDKISKRINQIQQRIFELADKVDVTMSASEIRKIDKIKSKLCKEKNKLMNKLYPKSTEKNIENGE
jgi:ribosome-associated translation inhibitor RaiA